MWISELFYDSYNFKLIVRSKYWSDSVCWSEIIILLFQESVSSSGSSGDFRHQKWTVEDPPDGGVWAWIIVLACGVLHLCSELVYYMFQNTIVIAKFRNPRLMGFGLAPESTYEDFQVFEDVRLMGGMMSLRLTVLPYST